MKYNITNNIYHYRFVIQHNCYIIRYIYIYIYIYIYKSKTYIQ